MQRQGVEDIKGKTPLGGQPPNIRRKLSKAELREQAAAATIRLTVSAISTFRAAGICFRGSTY